MTSLFHSRPITRRCILHVGSAKTGTSSIQLMLKKSRKRFLQHGILVPQTGQRTYGAHHRLAHDLAGLSEGSSDSVEQEFLREISRSSAHTVLMSSENFWPLLSVQHRAERLIDCLGALGFQIEVVVYVRNQPQYVNSSYVQNVKTWLYSGEFSDFAGRARSQRNKFTYSHWLTFAERHGVSLLARPFSEPVRRTGVTRDFLATIGLSSAEGFDSEIERNVSVGPFAVEVARRLVRRIGGPDRLTRLQADQCRSIFQRELKSRRVDDDVYCGLTTSLAADVETQFAEDNARFSHAAWGKPWDEVFASDVARHFEPNDYAIAGVPPGRRELLGEVIDTLGPKVDAISRGAPATGRKTVRSALSSLKARLPL